MWQLKGGWKGAMGYERNLKWGGVGGVIEMLWSYMKLIKIEKQ